MRFTQSISLSNIQTLSLLSSKARPEAVKKPAGPDSKICPACLQIGVTNDGGDLETANEFWWS
jgi:hypothetical protein